jgi:hypothetical protein
MDYFRFSINPFSSIEYFISNKLSQAARTTVKRIFLVLGEKAAAQAVTARMTEAGQGRLPTQI